LTAATARQSSAPIARAAQPTHQLTLSSVDQTFTQWDRGKAVKASTSAFAWSISGPILGKLRVSWSRTWSQAWDTATASGWANAVRNTAATMSLCDFGTRASRLRAK
jgi:cellulase/cellobiase CelA1